MDVEKKLEVLQQIQEVEAPPFLLTRIKQGIANKKNDVAPVKWQMAFLLVAFLIVTLNLALVLKSDRSKMNPNINSLVKSMELSNTNKFYNE